MAPLKAPPPFQPSGYQRVGPAWQVRAGHLQDGSAVLLAEGETSAISDLRRRHSRLDSPRCPRVCGEDIGAADWLLLDQHISNDVQQVWDRLAGRGERLPYSAGAALGRELALALADLHRVTGEAWGRGSWANVVLRPDTTPMFLFGPPLCTRPIMAPEVNAGSAATTASDVYLLWGLFQPLFSLAELPPMMRAALVGGEADPEYLSIFADVQRRAGASMPTERFPNIVAALDRWRQLWDALGHGPDLSAWASVVAGDHAPSATVQRLQHAADLAWVVLPDGTRVDLRRQGVVRRILRALITHREHSPGTGVPTADLIERVWPGERILEAAARNRLYVGMNKLRQLGLGPIVTSDDGGYQLDPSLHPEAVGST